MNYAELEKESVESCEGGVIFAYTHTFILDTG